jgi:prepilin-type processing-associated H-X9-DG protein
MKKTFTLLAFLAFTWYSASSIAAAQDEESEQRTVAGWVNLDVDRFGIQPWVGAAYPLGEVADFTADVFFRDTYARANLGIAFYIGPLSINPAVGISFDFDSNVQRATALVAPQLFTILEAGPIYFESWAQFFFQNMFAKEHSPARDYFYTRDFLLIVLHRYFAIGPQFEIDTTFNNSGGDLVASLPFGGRVNFSFGDGNVLGLFLGYEFDKSAKGPDASGLTGRVTFHRYW